MSNGKPRCLCPRCSVSGMIGPVVLITLGVLFLLAQMVTWLSFGKLWPLLLIVIGVLKLAESAASNQGHTG